MSHLTHVVRIRPQMYIHVLDQTTNITRVEVGPNTLICKQHEIVISGPTSMITIPPRHYVEIENPVLRKSDGITIEFDDFGQAELNWGEKEYRLAQEPFPLYPGEKLSKNVTPLEMVYKNHALHLRCIQDFTYDENESEEMLDTVTTNKNNKNNNNDESKAGNTEETSNIVSKKRSFRAGDEWLFEGPAVYVPNSNVEIIKKIEAVVIKQNEALKLVAQQNCIDREGISRIAGEQWLVRKPGAYLPSVYEKPLNVIKAKVLTDKQALHMRALKTFKDSFGQIRKDGEEWLITNNDIETYIPSVNEFVVKVVKITTLSSRQYCVIVNPFDTNTRVNKWGARSLVIGEKSFFLFPGETLEKGIENVYVLNEEQGLVLTCDESFTDNSNNKNVRRKPGDRWMIRGPMEYVPPIGAKVLRINKAISLGENEGIYVRNIKTGEVRAVIGQTYLLNENEQLWEKELPREVEELLATPRGYIALDDSQSRSRQFVEEIRARIAKRDRTRVVTYNVPHNHCVQVFDFRENVGRVVFGPALVLLQPAEVVTCLTLSGGKPKRGNVVKCLHLRLGPEFSSDIITVETSDHASLTVSLSYNWRFAVKDEKNHNENNKLFAVPDFIGDLCKTVSSKVRASVSSVPFDKFHTTSAKLIRTAVFGVDENGHVNDEFFFPANNLVLTGIDIRSIEPSDPKTREALQKSVQLAIEITAKAQEQNARHQQNMVEQIAKGKLERQKLVDQTEAETARKNLVEVAAETAKVKAIGIAEAMAKSKVESIMIKAKAKLQESELESQALEIETKSKMEELKSEHIAELEYLKQSYELKAVHAKSLAEIEVKKFEEMCNSIGRDTLKSIALAPPELRNKLLKGLSIDSSLLKGGSIPFVDLQ